MRGGSGARMNRTRGKDEQTGDGQARLVRARFLPDKRRNELRFWFTLCRRQANGNTRRLRCAFQGTIVVGSTARTASARLDERCTRDAECDSSIEGSHCRNGYCRCLPYFAAYNGTYCLEGENLLRLRASFRRREYNNERCFLSRGDMQRLFWARSVSSTSNAP